MNLKKSLGNLRRIHREFENLKIDSSNTTTKLPILPGTNAYLDTKTGKVVWPDSVGKVVESDSEDDTDDCDHQPETSEEKQARLEMVEKWRKMSPKEFWIKMYG